VGSVDHVSELQARLIAQKQQDSDADEGYDERIQKLEDTAQTVRNRIAWCKGEYEYDGEGGEAGVAEEDESEEELVLESGSDEDIEMGGGA
jgi:hypothetical protein